MWTGGHLLFLDTGGTHKSSSSCGDRGVVWQHIGWGFPNLPSPSLLYTVSVQFRSVSVWKQVDIQLEQFKCRQRWGPFYIQMQMLIQTRIERCRYRYKIEIEIHRWIYKLPRWITSRGWMGINKEGKPFGKKETIDKQTDWWSRRSQRRGKYGGWQTTSITSTNLQLQNSRASAKKFCQSGCRFVYQVFVQLVVIPLFSIKLFFSISFTFCFCISFHLRLLSLTLPSLCKKSFRLRGKY